MNSTEKQKRWALKMLKKCGQAAKVARTVTTGGGPFDPYGGTSTTTRHDVLLVVSPVSVERLDGTNVVVGDYRVICSTTDVELTTSDKIECSAGTLLITELRKHAPDGVTIFYDMTARG